MPIDFTSPPVWTQAQLNEDRVKSEEMFRVSRTVEGRAKYTNAFKVAVPAVNDVLEKTADLRKLTAESLLKDARLWQVLRYFCGPQISQEDFWTLVGKKFTKITPDIAEAAARIVRELLDHHRLPWVEGGHNPTKAERSAAVLATATLFAHEQLRTNRRGEVSRGQEDEVADVLKAATLKVLPKEDRKSISQIDDLPTGTFCKEQKILAAKCDVPVRLFDGRLMAIECKVSNGPKNSWKRLLREVGGKSDSWRGHFHSHIVVAAVIAGVFDLRCLERAQEEHAIAIFWQHNLEPLKDFVSFAR